MAESLECLDFDLTDSFAGHAIVLADLFQGLRPTFVKSEPPADDIPLPVVQITHSHVEQSGSLAGLNVLECISCAICENAFAKLDWDPGNGTQLLDESLVDFEQRGCLICRQDRERKTFPISIDAAETGQKFRTMNGHAYESAEVLKKSY